MINNKEAFEMLGKEVAEIVLLAVRNELAAQGHNMTGSLSKSIEYEVKAEATKAIIDFSMLEYGMPLNYGVDKSKVPYNPGSGKKSSKYIDGLKFFVLKRMGLVGKEAERVAFAIARKHKDEGIPTNGSKVFSSNGRRKDWISEGLKEANPKVVETINRVFEEVIQGFIKQAFIEISNKNSENLKVTVK